MTSIDKILIICNRLQNNLQFLTTTYVLVEPKKILMINSIPINSLIDRKTHLYQFRGTSNSDLFQGTIFLQNNQVFKISTFLCQDSKLQKFYKESQALFTGSEIYLSY